MYNIMIVGVGGQGSLLASRILGALYTNRGFDVKVSEVHGMSQRGGSVVTYVRAGENIASPIIAPGDADLILGFEQLEALRWAHYLKPGGSLIYSTQEIKPMPVLTGAMEYPADIPVKLEEYNIKKLAVDALTIATRAGSPKAANVVLLGAASVHSGTDISDWETALRETVPLKYLELNLRAFKAGRECAAD